MEYSAEVVRRFDSFHGLGELPPGTPGLVAGEAEDRTLQVWIRFQWQVIDGIIRQARFQVFGCPHTVAAASRVAEELVEQRAASAAAPDVEALQRALGVPVEKLGKLLRIEDAVANCRRALEDRDV